MSSDDNNPQFHSKAESNDNAKVTSGVWRGWDREEALYWARVLIESGIGPTVSFGRGVSPDRVRSSLPITSERLRADLFERNILPEVAGLPDTASNWRSFHGSDYHAAWLDRVADFPAPTPQWSIEPTSWQVRDPLGNVHTLSNETVIATVSTLNSLDPEHVAEALGLPADIGQDARSSSARSSGTSSETDEVRDPSILTSGSWRSWTHERATQWAEVFFAFRRSHFVLPWKGEAYRIAWEKFRAWGELPSFNGWPEDAATYEVKGLGPDDYAADELERGRKPYGEPGRIYMEKYEARRTQDAS